MRPITRITLCALTAAAMAAPAVAATNFYLQLGPVKGEELDERKGRENKIEVLSSEFGTARKGWDGTIKGRGARDSSSGMPTGKRQHGWVKVSQPLDQGNLRIKVKFPWIGCRVGAAYADAVVEDGAGRVELTDVIIAGCAADAVELNYAKVTVRGWDAATKKE